MHLLLIEDDPMVGQALQTVLQNEAYAVDWVRDGNQGLIAARSGGIALVLLDLGLPGRDGLDLLRQLRSQGSDLPVLILTARDELDDRVAGLDAGADDYLIKPVDTDELMARLRAILRRRGGGGTNQISNGEIVLDLATHEVSYRDISQVLPRREFVLLALLMERPGVIFSRSQIEDRIYAWGDEPESNVVDVLLHSIRRRFGAGIIRNVRGTGWMVARRSE